MKRIKLIAAAIVVPTTVVVAVGTVLVTRYRERKRREKSFIPEGTRRAAEELLTLQAQDFVPDGVGTSLYERTLSTLSDRQLLALYALTKVGEVMRRRGVDVHRPSRAELKEAGVQFHEALRERQTREELLKKLGGFGRELLQEVLKDGVTLMAAQA